MPYQHLTVNLINNNYDIIIGENLSNKLLTFLKQYFPAAKIAIITDENVKELYGNSLCHFLQSQHYETQLISVPAGENSKSFDQLQYILDKLLEHHFERFDIILALGGGVVGDLAGFAASIFKRSIPFIQIATTLLAQIDSAIGGKTGINTKYGKNLIGSFYQPKLVLNDINYLKTLNKRELLAGYSEMVKYGLINDREFFDFLDENQKQLFNNKNLLSKAIFIAAKAKAQIVQYDEKEHGNRALLNLGHSFAHVLESFLNYNPEHIIHGEAVSVGIVLAFQFSNFLGYCTASDILLVEEHFKKIGLPTAINQLTKTITVDDFLRLIKQDKKNNANKLNLILARKIGDSFIAKNVDEHKLTNFLLTKL